MFAQELDTKFSAVKRNNESSEEEQYYYKNLRAKTHLTVLFSLSKFLCCVFALTIFYRVFPLKNVYRVFSLTFILSRFFFKNLGLLESIIPRGEEAWSGS